MNLQGRQLSQASLHMQATVTFKQAVPCIASPKFWGAKYFDFKSNTIVFGTPPLKAQNNKIW